MLVPNVLFHFILSKSILVQTQPPHSSCHVAALRYGSHEPGARSQEHFHVLVAVGCSPLMPAPKKPHISTSILFAFNGYESWPPSYIGEELMCSFCDVVMVWMLVLENC